MPDFGQRCSSLCLSWIERRSHWLSVFEMWEAVVLTLVEVRHERATSIVFGWEGKFALKLFTNLAEQ